jgi:hypothetical protein
VVPPLPLDRQTLEDLALERVRLDLEWREDRIIEGPAPPAAATARLNTSGSKGSKCGSAQ